jgi:TolB-like protein/Flp pilus assembly protein TadD
MGAVLTFGSFEFDPVGPTLHRAGAPLKVGQRALALLTALIEAGGKVVAKPELMDRAWPGLFVEEANLSVQISQLRRLLGPRPDGGDWIVTVPGLGYRFTQDRLPSAVRGDRPGLVVLPFDHVEGDAGVGYFADGVVTDLIAALTRFRSFCVLSRSIAFTYRHRVVDSRQVARELGVRYVLEGALRRNGNKLRVTTQLVDGISGDQIWAERFEGSLDDVFAVQDAIVESVAVRVEPSVQATELARSRRERPASVVGYDIYLRALADLTDESEPANRCAFALLREALLSDPDNAAILAQAAWALEHRHTMGWPALGEDDVELCLRLARRALQHAQGDAVVMAQCGMALLQAGRDYESGVAVIRAAAAANPNALFVSAAAGVAAIHCGDLDEAESLLLRVTALSPLDPDTRFALCGLAMIHIIRGKYELALARAGHALAVNQHYDATYWMLVAANAHLGRMAEAKRHLASLRQLAPNISLSSIRAGQPAMIHGRIEPILDGLRLAGLEF